MDTQTQSSGGHGKYTLLMLVTMTLWGSLYISNRVLLSALPVLLVVCFRFTIGGAVLLLTAKCLHLEFIHKEDLPVMLFVGVIGYFTSNALLTVCTSMTSASLSSLLNSMNPLFIVLFAHFLLKEELTARRIVLILLSIVGAVIIIGSPGNKINLLGVLCALGSVLLWSFSVSVMKRLTGKYHPIVVTAYGQSIAGVCSLIGTGIQFARGATATFSPVIIGNILFISLCCTGLAHMLWNYCVAHEGAGRCAAFYPIQPMVSMLFGVLLLGEKMTLSFLIGSAIIIVSVALNALPGKKSE